MRALLCNSAYFGAILSLGAYFIGMRLQKRFRLALLNPIMISVALSILLLRLLEVDYASYKASAHYLSDLLTPATVCLAIPLYEQIQPLKRNLKGILAGILAGVLASALTIWALALLFGLNHAEYVTLLPKSITTAIGVALSEEMGGYASITVAAIVITGVLGNMFAERFLRLFRIENPVARGVAIGTSAHAVGTARAMELGEIEGAMSSLSIAVSGLLTVVGVQFFAALI